MAELDLIPQDYRKWINQRAMFRQYVAAFVILNLVVMVSSVFLAQLAKKASAHARELHTRSAITGQQHAQLEQLKLQQAEYERRWFLLRGLQAGAAVEDIFKIIDVALADNELWFVNWKFRRAGVVIDGKARAVETGYFLIVPTEEQRGEEPAWHVETHMTLQGQAKDHQALSTFLRALFKQRDIRDVKVQRTSLIDYAGGRVVSFELTIVLNSLFEGF